MPPTAVEAQASPITVERPRRAGRSPLRRLVLASAREPVGTASAVVLLSIVLVSLFGQQLSGTEPATIYPAQRFLAPGGEHWFGTDNLGRDVFARVAAGGRSTIRVASLSVILAATLGIAIGVLAAYYGRWVDLLLSRLVDAMLAVPGLLLAMTLVLALGQTERAIVLAIAGIEVPRVARVARAAVLAVRAEQYVDAARSVGAGDLRLMLRHLLPQTMNAMVVLASSILGAAILIDAGLSFLGVGRPPTEPTWGGMVSGVGRTFLASAWWIAVFPGVFLTLTVLAFNLLGDSLRALLDPRARGR